MKMRKAARFAMPSATIAMFEVSSFGENNKDIPSYSISPAMPSTMSRTREDRILV
jgi:hypothetical protein